MNIEIIEEVKRNRKEMNDSYIKFEKSLSNAHHDLMMELEKELKKRFQNTKVLGNCFFVNNIKIEVYTEFEYDEHDENSASNITIGIYHSERQWNDNPIIFFTYNLFTNSVTWTYKELHYQVTPENLIKTVVDISAEVFIPNILNISDKIDDLESLRKEIECDVRNIRDKSLDSVMCALTSNLQTFETCPEINNGMLKFHNVEIVTCIDITKYPTLDFIINFEFYKVDNLDSFEKIVYSCKEHKAYSKTKEIYIELDNLIQEITNTIEDNLEFYVK